MGSVCSSSPDSSNVPDFDPEDYDIQAKILLIGRSDAGKEEIIESFAPSIDSEGFNFTITKLLDRKVKLRLQDSLDLEAIDIGDGKGMDISRPGSAEVTTPVACFSRSGHVTDCSMPSKRGGAQSTCMPHPLTPASSWQENLYRGSSAVLLCYDVSNVKTYHGLEQRSGPCIRLIKSLGEEVFWNVVGTHCDCPKRSKQVTTDMGAALAERLGARFFEADAASGTGLEKGFAGLTSDIVLGSEFVPSHSRRFTAPVESQAGVIPASPLEP